jgi:ubiquinone/menaquinone biosynthesis C-methylase UbiE
MAESHTAFVGSIPANYDRYLGPLIFEEYAADLANRVSAVLGTGKRVLETAAGTGIATRALRSTLAADVELVVTDLNEPMLEHAKAKFAADENIAFQPANAMNLPFPDASFDAVVCQFSVMFFPDKLEALREVIRGIGQWWIAWTSTG